MWIHIWAQLSPTSQLLCAVLGGAAVEDRTSDRVAEGEAQVRAPATAHDTHRTQEEKGGGTQRRREATHRIPDRTMQASIPPYAAYPRSPSARGGIC